MKNRILSWNLLLVIVIIVSLFSACNLNQGQQNINLTPIKVALLLEGTIYDQGWDSLAYEGLRMIERSIPSEISYAEKVTLENMEEVTRTYAEGGYQLIFGHGAVFQETFNALGKEYPHISFVFFNGEPVGNNVKAVSFVPESMGFFAGMTAALMTKTGIVGIIPAYKKQREVTGFIAGVNYVNSNIQILVEEVGNWGDRHRGREIADGMLKNKADVLYGVGDGFNIEVIDAARENSAYAIGFVTDQSFISRDTILVSFLQNVDQIYVQIAERIYKKEQIKVHQIFDFTNGGQTFTAFGMMVPEEKRQIIIDAIERYKKGKLKILS